MGLRAVLVLGLGGLALAAEVGRLQEIIPDTSLGLESSQLTRDFIPQVDLVSGGAQRGKNLFHSFENFDISSFRSVFFIFNSGIENVLARITGNKKSNILGTLGTQEIL